MIPSPRDAGLALGKTEPTGVRCVLASNTKHKRHKGEKNDRQI
jgi:hypothetical protein